MENIIERFKERDENQRKENEEKQERATENTLKAAEMRKLSLETFIESQNRNSEEVTPKRTRNHGNDTISNLTAAKIGTSAKTRGYRNSKGYYPTARSTSECSPSKSTKPTSSYAIRITKTSREIRI